MWSLLGVHESLLAVPSPVSDKANRHESKDHHHPGRCFRDRCDGNVVEKHGRVVLRQPDEFQRIGAQSQQATLAYGSEVLTTGRRVCVYLNTVQKDPIAFVTVEAPKTWPAPSHEIRGRAGQRRTECLQKRSGALNKAYRRDRFAAEPVRLIDSELQKSRFARAPQSNRRTTNCSCCNTL